MSVMSVISICNIDNQPVAEVCSTVTELFPLLTTAVLLTLDLAYIFIHILIHMMMMMMMMMMMTMRRIMMNIFSNRGNDSSRQGICVN